MGEAWRCSNDMATAMCERDGNVCFSLFQLQMERFSGHVGRLEFEGPSAGSTAHGRHGSQSQVDLPLWL